MLTGIAEGGPHDGVKLTAAFSWNGMITRPAYERRTYAPIYYPGKYMWVTDRWLWHPGTFKRTLSTRADETRWALIIE